MPPRQKRPAAGAPASDDALAPPKAAHRAGKAEPSKASRHAEAAPQKASASRPSASLEDIKARMQEQLQALTQAAEEGVQEQLSSCITQGMAAIAAKAKEHHQFVNNELKLSLEMQEQVKSQHERALSEVKRVAAEANRSLEKEPDLKDMVAKARQAAVEDVRRLQAKYTRAAA